MAGAAAGAGAGAGPSAATAAAAAAAAGGGDLFGLEDAPVFYPTDEEFEDPYAYFEKIRRVGERAGICKIVPPSTWKPPFSVDPEVRFAGQASLARRWSGTEGGPSALAHKPRPPTRTNSAHPRA